MSERLRLTIGFTGLLVLWFLTLFFLSFDRSRDIALIASSVIFLLFFGLLAIYFKRTLRPAHRSQSSTKTPAAAALKHTSSKSNLTEAEFVSNTYETILAQMQRQQKELTELQNKLSGRAASAEVFSHHIVNSLPSGLIAFDAEGLVRIANAPAHEIFPHLQNKQNNKLTHSELFAHHAELLQLITESLFEGKVHSRVEIDYQTQNQKKKLGLTVAPLEIEKELCGALCLVADISEIALLREQTERQRNLESLGVMSAGLAHELKNALATLHSYAQFIRRSTENENNKQAASALTREIRNLSEMINSFLNFARPQALFPSSVNLKVLVSECLMETLTYAEQSQVTLDISGEFPIIRADETLLRQVIINLLRNAIEAASQSAVKAVEVKGYLTSNEIEEKWMNIEVTDTGQGIKEEDFDFIFVPFFTTKQHGHGIGLALSHRIVTEHRGMLLAANAPNKGAVFTVKLPFEANPVNNLTQP